MILIAVANGALREAWRIWPIASNSQAIAIGAMWLVLTIAFEFALGRLVSGLSWRQMIADCDLSAGRLWALVPYLGHVSAVRLLPLLACRLSADRLAPPRQGGRHLDAASSPSAACLDRQAGSDGTRSQP